MNDRRQKNQLVLAFMEEDRGEASKDLASYTDARPKLATSCVYNSGRTVRGNRKCLSPTRLAECAITVQRTAAPQIPSAQLRKTHPPANTLQPADFCPAGNRCRIVPGYTSFDPRGRK